MKVYTKTGDKGKTSLIGGQRISKDDVRVEAYGTVDELISFVALLRDKMELSQVDLGEYRDDLKGALSNLMTLSSLLAVDDSTADKVPALKAGVVEAIELRIDIISSQLPKIDKFTIPGGNVLLSLSHVCRTVCRRAERRSVSAIEQFDLSEDSVIYLNRLSDYFYVLGRKLGCILGVQEELWIP